jgi:hypothetical protein
MARTYSFLTLLGLAVAAVQSAPSADAGSSDTREVANASGTGYQISWRASKKSLERAPRWDGRREPPLSVAAAIQIARKYLASRSPAGSAAVEKVMLHHALSAADDYPGVDRPDYFVYWIEFEAPPGPMWKPERYVVVLLDGSVVIPKVTLR